MQHDVVADDAILADGEGETGVGVQRAIVLDLAPGADLDPLVIAAQYRAVPNADIGMERHAPDDGGGLGDPIEAICGKLRSLPIELINRHARSSLPAARRAPFPARLRVSSLCDEAPNSRVRHTSQRHRGRDA